MAVSSPVSVEEYLGRGYEPDCDYVDGLLEERNVGEIGHADAQGRLYAYILFNFPGFWAAPEVRVQVKKNRFRVPDVTVVYGPRPQGKIVQQAPIAVAEVLSPEDGMHRVQQRIDDYLKFGVSAVWVLDPEDKRAFIHTSGGSREAKDGMLRTPADPELIVPLTGVFL
jgi:Uma2 family endonuclease